MIQLNLLPELKKDFIRAQKTKSLVISASIIVTICSLGLSAILFVYVNFLQQVQINLATDSISDKESKLESISDINKYLTIQAQLAVLPELHNGKGSYDRLFDFLSVINPASPNNIYLTNLQLLTEGQTITLTGTTQSYETLNVFVDTLKNAEASFKKGGEGDSVTENIFNQVFLQTADLAKSNGQEIVSFVVTTAYNPDVFDVQNTDVVASVPNITTTQSVTESTGTEQIFNSSETQ